MIIGWRAVVGELVLAAAATGASARVMTAAAAMTSFLFRVIPVSMVKIGRVTGPTAIISQATASSRDPRPRAAGQPAWLAAEPSRTARTRRARTPGAAVRPGGTDALVSALCT